MIEKQKGPIEPNQPTSKQRSRMEKVAEALEEQRLLKSGQTLEKIYPKGRE